jgi:general stress protein 26
MQKEILEYLKTQRIGVLAIEMLDGSPHGSTVHFAHIEDPLVFYFETYREYRKAETLYGREKSRASFVIGCDEKNMKTFQLDGVVELLKPEEKTIIDSVYLEKFPVKKEKSKDPKFIFFKFTPKWWRFTDWTRPEGKIILTSDV